MAKITYAGIEYRTIGALCAAYGVEQSLYTKRLTRGGTMEQALGLEPLNEGYTLNGTHYESASHICRAFGFYEKKAKQAIKNPALLLDPEFLRNRNKNQTSVYGKTYESINYMLAETGLDHGTLYKHARDDNTSLGKAAEKLVGCKENIQYSHTVEGLFFDCTVKMLKHFSIKPYKLREMRSKLRCDTQTAAQAIIDEKKKFKNINEQCVIVNGRSFKSIADMCKHFGLTTPEPIAC